MKSISDIKTELDRFEGITWSNCGYPLKIDGQEKSIKVGWLKFEIEKSELGWRTLEFIAWIIDDLMRSGEEIHFFPTSPPPFLNEPGQCLSFVMEFYPESGDKDINFEKISDFISHCYNKYWQECKL